MSGTRGDICRGIVRPSFPTDSRRFKHPPPGKGWEAHTSLLYLKREIDQRNEIEFMYNNLCIMQ